MNDHCVDKGCSFDHGWLGWGIYIGKIVLSEHRSYCKEEDQNWLSHMHGHSPGIIKKSRSSSKDS